MVIIGLAIYIISAIGAILYIRYDSENESDSVLLLVLCPALNSVVAIYELGKFLIYIDDRFLSKLLVNSKKVERKMKLMELNGCL